MPKFSADYIFPVSSPPVKNGTVVMDENGVITEVSDSQHAEAEIYKGIICPGFVNTHCHLELSYLKGEIPEKTGMNGFIKNLLSKRSGFSDQKIREAIIRGEKEMINNGIVAVGDISNNESSFLQKAKQNLLYHTFIEIFDLDSAYAEEVFTNGTLLENKLGEVFSEKSSKPHSSIVPHAPYTVSEKLLYKIETHALKNNAVLTIHNQESEGENDLFINKTGALAEMMNQMNIPVKATGYNSLRSTLVHLPKGSKILLVHNTYTSAEDIRWAHSYSNCIYWCFCPNANLFIENKLPDFNSFIKENAKITIGTDSLASNKNLSVLEELKTISKYSPDISLEILLLWATRNGAEFLGFEAEKGSIEKGKTPGLNLITGMNGVALTADSTVKKLV